MMKMCIGVVVVLALLTPIVAQDRLAVELTRYQQEADPVRKARELTKLGNDQFALARKQLDGGQDAASLQSLDQYRDEVRETVAGLKASGIDAVKKPEGFKQLQISLREIVRRIDDLILTLPMDERPSFREVRSDLANAQNELIDALFPRRPDQKSRKMNP